jgi:hypothetical protein
MPSLDLSYDYKKVKDKLSSTKTYTDLKSQYDTAKKAAGDSLEQVSDSVKSQIDSVKDEVKRYQKEIKSQFEELLDISKVTGGKGSDSIQYVKKLLIKTVKNIQPQIQEILLEESINAVGCDQQQTYDSQVIFIRIKACDLGGLLKKDPSSNSGKVLYEKDQNINTQSVPYSMNRQLYTRIQNIDVPYSIDYGNVYNGSSGQGLMDIEYVEIGGESLFKITLPNRLNNVNRVGEFLVDYYKTIKPFEFTNVMANITNSLSGAISIDANIGLVESEDATKFELLIQRVLGLCFDNVSEIDVSGISKVGELDSVDDSFFEFNEIDLRNIDQKITNIKNGVIEYLDCTTQKLPIDAQSILSALNELNFIEGSDQEDAADRLTSDLAQNPQWNGLAFTGNIKAALDLNFVKLIVNGIIFSLLTPKVILPILTMLKALQQAAIDEITGFVEFMKVFRKFVTNLISKIGAIFVKELFALIKRDILNLLQTVIQDLAKEQKNKKIIMILKLIQLLLIVAQFISDWRKCKSVVDEILMLLKVALTGFGGSIPIPLLFASQLLDGFSATRAFIGTIEELQKLGIPTGPMPDGSPNLHVLSVLSQLKAMSDEEAENGKVQIAVPPLAITPAGLTIPSSAFGKKI